MYRTNNINLCTTGTKLNFIQEAGNIYLPNKFETKWLTLLMLKEFLQINEKKTNILKEK